MHHHETRNVEVNFNFFNFKLHEYDALVKVCTWAIINIRHYSIRIRLVTYFFLWRKATLSKLRKKRKLKLQALGRMPLGRQWAVGDKYRRKMSKSIWYRFDYYWILPRRCLHARTFIKMWSLGQSGHCMLELLQLPVSW